MSVFRVKLNNTVQGQLDVDPNGVSLQRQVVVSGPNRTYRLLRDGETFTDCNYFKRYAFPQMDLETSFLEVVEDDGSLYVDGEVSSYLRVYDLSVADGSDFDENVADVLGDTGSHAVFTMISNNGTEDLKVKLNGSVNSVFDLAAGSTQVYNAGDLNVTKIEIANTDGEAANEVQIQVSVASTCNS